MGNLSNENNWSARERMRRLELLLWWRGWAGRGDLLSGFGISPAQASGDLQRYVELNPGALVYHTSRKRYEGTPDMRCILHEPKLEEAVWFFHGGDAPGSSMLWQTDPSPMVAMFRPLIRRASAQVERRIFLAMEQKRVVRVKYASLNGGRSEWREIAPRALAHDGHRWHVRAWCVRNKDFRDFAPSRMEETEWPGNPFEPPVVDEEWERIVKLTLGPHPSLDAEQRRAIELDYGMKNGQLVVEVRAAMREYFLAHYRIPVMDANGKPRPQHLDLLEES